jgi:hypothetical protein
MNRLLAFLAIAALFATTAAGAPSKQGLRLVKRQPLELRGTHFPPNTRVRVKVTRGLLGVNSVRTVHTTQTGTFTVSFGVLQGYDRCTDGLLIVATGLHKAARLNVPPIECPPA